MPQWEHISFDLSILEVLRFCSGGAALCGGGGGPLFDRGNWADRGAPLYRAPKLDPISEKPGSWTAGFQMQVRFSSCLMAANAISVVGFGDSLSKSR